MTWMYVTQMCAIAGPGFFYLTPWVLFLDVSHPWTGGLGFPQLFGPHLMVLLPFSPGPEKARFRPSFGWTRPQATDYVFFSFLTRTAYDLEGTTSGASKGAVPDPKEESLVKDKKDFVGPQPPAYFSLVVVDDPFGCV